MPLKTAMPSHIAPKTNADPKSGCSKTNKNGNPKYKLDIKRCKNLAISTWRLEKYFARSKIKIGLISSTGSKVTEWIFIQLAAPLVASPKITAAAGNKNKNKKSNKKPDYLPVEKIVLASAGRRTEGFHCD